MVELVGNIPDDAVLQARLDILYGQTPDITIKAHELPEESGPTVEKSGTLAEPVFDIGIPQAMGAVAAREYAKQAEAARDAAVLAGETAKEELNGIVAFADDALDQKITETGIALDEKVATAAQRASEAASSAAAAAQKAAAAEQAMQGAQAAQAQAEQSAQEAAENTAMAKDFASGQPVTYSGAPVSIAYAGTNRIASITAYGENAQGGTTETPVALTGISSVTVNDDVTELPIPRPLHKVGDVRDVCRTRVKSVYDKRIVLDGTEYWFISRGVFFYKSAVTDNALTMAACDRYKFHITDNGVSGVTTDKTFAFNIATPERIMIRDDDYTSIEEFKAHLTDNPLTVYYQSTAYDGTNGLDVCLTEYLTGFAELDGKNVQASYYQNNGRPYGLFVTRNIIKTNDGVVCSQAKTEPANLNWGYVYAANVPLTDIIFGLIGSDITSGTELNAYLAAQKEAGTPVQVAYQLATPEVYATDPVDFDNAAGPLTVMTGGELEVRMTELIGSRSPEFAGKMDKATYDADEDGVVDEAEKVSNALTLKNAAGEVVATFDGSEAAILQLTAALVGALGKTEKAADSSKLAGLAPVVDNPGPNNRNTWYFPFTGTNNRDGTRKYYAALYADNATTAGRASNLSMGLNGTDLWVYYS